MDEAAGGGKNDEKVESEQRRFVVSDVTMVGTAVSLIISG